MSPGSFREWARQNPLMLDAAVAGFVAFVGLPIGWPSGLIELVLSAALSLPLFLRRWLPAVSFTVISLACAVQVVLQVQPLLANVAFPLGLYALSTYARRDWIRVAGLAVGLIGVPLGCLAWYEISLPILLIGWLVVTAVWLLGSLIRTRWPLVTVERDMRVMHLREFYDWSRRHPALLDAGIVVLLALFSSPALSRQGVVETALSIPMIGALYWRRRYPTRVFTAISLLCAVQVVLLAQPISANIAFLLSLYALSAYTDRLGLRLAGLAVGGLGCVLGVGRWYLLELDQLPNLLVICLLVLAVWLLGDLMRTRRAYINELEERARRLEFERDQQDRIARSAERARIAREMHDVVAHSLSIVIAQADGGRYAAEQDPEAAKHSLEIIGRTGRRASAEMRRLLGVLRTEATTDADAEAGGSAPATDPAAASAPSATTDPAAPTSPRSEPPTPGAAESGALDEPDYSPQPSVQRIPQLVEEMSSGGLDCELLLDQPSDALPEGLSLAAYRLVQEGLTNALKHGGPKVRATVELRQDGDSLLIEVRDDGRGAAAVLCGQAGHGLSGMAERVQLFGGTLATGPRAGGGFLVRAEIPIREPASVPGGATVGGPEPEARRTSP